MAVNRFLGNRLPVAQEAADKVYRGRYLIFSVGAIGTFMATLDGSILTIALPTIAAQFQVGVETVAWIVLAYSLTLISLMMIFGAWVERRGYLFGYLFGYIVFTVGSLLCALANSVEFLVVSRIVQAVGTAMFAALGPGLVATVFPPEERGKGIGLMIMMVSAGFMIGFPLGGFLLRIWSWPWLFLINLPIGIVGLVLSLRFLRLLPEPTNRTPLPLASGVALAIALVGLTYGFSLLHDHALPDPIVIGSFAAFAIGGTAFLWFESKPRHALIGLKIFQNKSFSLALVTQTMQFLATSGVMVLLPFYFEEIRSYSPDQVGLHFLLLPLMMFIGAPLSGRLVDKIGLRWPSVAGMVATTIGLVLMSRFQPGSSETLIITSICLIGLGTGLFSTPNATAMMGSVSERERATASGILATNRNIGMSIGVALATSVYTYFRAAESVSATATRLFTAGFQPVIYLSIFFSVIGLLLCFARSNRITPQTG